MVETAVHATFYIQMLDELGFNTKEFHDKAFNDPEIKQRLEFIVKCLNGDSDLLALAAMCFLEGTALFSSLASLMSFRKPRSINAMQNMASGIVHSCQDELLHCLVSASAHNELLKQLDLSSEELLSHHKSLVKMREDIVAHELLLIEKKFAFGESRTVAKEDLIRFVEHRGDECLSLMEVSVLRDERPNPIAQWLYPMVKSYNFGDFFQTTQKDYEKFVNKERFTW